eukprot:s2361_g9.t1
MAMNHASTSLWARAFPLSPWTTQPATTFGNEVWFRSKVYQGKAEKKHEAAGTRWKKGWYGGPLMDVKRGHVILRDDGGLTVAKSVKFNVVDSLDEYHGLLPPAAEAQYTPDIETLLSNLVKSGKPLEVTCNVFVNVRKNLAKWRPSAQKEFGNLKEAKRAFAVKKRNFGERPDSSRAGTMCRKIRQLDLFAAGIDAMWLGDPVALEPPAIAFEFGLAERGDMWCVEQAIYGLRESPALWSRFRDKELRKARWTIQVNGEPVTLKLEQLVSDDQIWRIAREDAKDTEAYGYVLVYIDDLLIPAEDQTMQGFFQWLSAKWEVDALDVLQEGHPIRFLGMELHQVEGGALPRRFHS